jgi:hypothetical protein
MNHISDKSHFYAVILFVISPFLAVISAFANNKKSWAKNIFWAFCAFYGLVFAIGTESSGSDVVRAVSRLTSLHATPMSLSMAIEYFAQSGNADIVSTIVVLTVSRFTENQSLLTMIYGFIFGYFFSRNLWFILDRLNDKLHAITILLVVCFFLVNPIWNLNGFRFWTATHIFVFGMLQNLYEGKNKGLWISLASILVHYTFLIPVSALLAYKFLGNRAAIYFFFFLSTFLISEIDIESFNRTVETYAPDIIQERSDSYRSEERVQEYRERSGSSKNWYAAWYGTALKWSVMGFLVILFFQHKKSIASNKAIMNIFCFSLLFYGIANLMSSIPSGGRFVSVANLAALATIIFYVQNIPNEKAMLRFIKVATPALLLFIIVAFRTGFYSFSATMILGNPLIAFFTAGENISLNDVMKMFL